LVVVRSRATTRDALSAAIRSLVDVQAHILGGVLNDVDASRRGQGYLKGGYYHYYRSEDYRQDADDHSQSAA